MKNLILTLMSCLLLNISCKDGMFGYDSRFQIRNDYNKPIYFGDASSYPDTSLYGQGAVPTTSEITYKLAPDESKHLNILCCWEDYINKLPGDTLMIFIFDADTLEQNSWEEVQKGYKILQRYDLSVQDLERLNWRISYPASPEMKGMKMYPR